MKELLNSLVNPIEIVNLIKNYRIHLRALYRKLFPSKDYCKVIFGKKSVLDGFLDEIRMDIINEDLEKKLKIFRHIKGKTARGYTYSSGVVSKRQGHIIYSIVRKKKPNLVIETGTGNGYSTSFILKALHLNNQGMLYSIDYPEIEGQNYPKDNFYKDKGGAVIPKGKTSGWLVPDYLYNRLRIIIGKSQDILPKLLRDIGSIDIFFHDSEHSYSGMIFEFEQVWPYLNEEGILLIHDINWNNAFVNFAKRVNKRPFFIDGSLGFIIK